jgi:glycerol-3-phosphate acyltransferase PlsY
MSMVMGIVCYAVGSIPTAYLLAKLIKGVDIRTVGSGNVGATNALRVLGAWAGVTVFVIDLFKGVAAARLIPSWWFGEVSLSTSLTCGLMAVLGHDFPCWLRFRGGKGVATTIGVLMGSAMPVASVVFITWGAVFALTRYVSIGSMVAAAAIPLSQLWFQHSSAAIGLGGALALLIIVQHRANLQRLLAGTEHRARG